MFHGIDGDRRVQLPVGADIDQIDILTFTNLFPQLLLPAVGSRLGKSGIGQNLLRTIDVGGNQIAQSNDFDSVDLRIALDCAAAARPQADKGHAHRVNRITPQLQYILLACRTGWLREFDQVALLIVGATAVEQQ